MDKQQQKMDTFTLPDISFISSDELSSLSFISDEETQLTDQSNKTINLELTSSTIASNTIVSKSASSNKNEISDLENSSSCVRKNLSKLNEINFVNKTITLTNQANSQVNESIILNKDQTFYVQSSINNLQNHQPIRNEINVQLNNRNLDRHRTFQSANSGFKITNANLGELNRPKSILTSTPLIDKNDNEMLNILNNTNQSTLFSPIKCDDYQTNYFSIKSAALEDSLFSCLEDIENTDSNFLYTTTLSSSDDFDLIL